MGRTFKESDYTNISEDSNNTGVIETNYENLDELFYFRADRVDTYAVNFNYVNSGNVAEFEQLK